MLDESVLVVALGEHVAVEGVVAGVAGGAGEPAAVDAGILVEDLLRLLVPVDAGGGLGPEHLRAALPMRIDVVIAAGAGVHRPLPYSLRRLWNGRRAQTRLAGPAAQGFDRAQM